MRKIKIVSVALILSAVLFFPFVFTMLFAVLTEEQFDRTFVGALDEKFDRLTLLEGEKIIVVGGSSVAFGLDSERLEKYTGMPVVNFGLYASLGTKMMLDLSLAGVGKGDIVVVAPEINKETLSLFFNADTAWRAVEGDFSMLGYIGFDNVPAMAGAVWGYSIDKLSRMREKSVDESGVGIYLSEYFNEYGDFAYPRMENVMHGYYDPNTLISLSLDDYGEELEEFIDYLNKYVKKCRRRGASVYFTYSPMNELALADTSSAEACEEFAAYLEDKLICEIIETPEECILDGGYFYDTNFHLNDVGVELRTIRLAKALKLAASITDAGVIKDKEPEAPTLPEIDVLYNGYDENSVYFTYEKRPDGSFAITGLTDAGRNMESLTIPLGYDGYRVTAVKSGALASEKLCSLTVSADSYLAIFENGAFLDTPNLTDLYIYKMSGDDIAPPMDFGGTGASFTVHIPRGSDFRDHYYWGERKVIYKEMD